MIRARLVRVPALSPTYREEMYFARAAMLSRLFCRRLLAGKVFRERNVVGTADEDRHPLMILGRCDVQDSLGSRARLPARLLGEHAHGRDLVEEPELGLGLRGVAHIGGVHEDAAIEEGAMDVRHHGPGVAQGVGT